MRAPRFLVEAGRRATTRPKRGVCSWRLRPVEVTCVPTSRRRKPLVKHEAFGRSGERREGPAAASPRSVRKALPGIRPRSAPLLGYTAAPRLTRPHPPRSFRSMSPIRQPPNSGTPGWCGALFGSRAAAGSGIRRVRQAGASRRSQAGGAGHGVSLGQVALLGARHQEQPHACCSFVRLRCRRPACLQVHRRPASGPRATLTTVTGWDHLPVRLMHRTGTGPSHHGTPHLTPSPRT